MTDHNTPPRTADAIHGPWEHINAAQINADKYEEAWRRALVFGLPLVAVAVMAVVLFVTAIRAGDKLDADLRWVGRLEAMK